MLYDPAPEAELRRGLTDEQIRGYGYRIADRPTGREPWWVSAEGELMSESTVIQEITQRRRENRAAVSEAIALERERRNRSCKGR